MKYAPEITAVSAVVCLVVLGLSLGMLASGATLNLNFGQPAKPVNSVALSIIPDYGGAANDSFVFADTLQKAATIHVSAGQVTFTINNLDTALNMNYSQAATIPFTFLNDTPSGTFPVHYNTGDQVSMTIGHTFTIAGIGEVPLPADASTTFTLTLKTGTYHYYCIVQCGPGMDYQGYMQGQIVVQ